MPYSECEPIKVVWGQSPSGVSPWGRASGVQGQRPWSGVLKLKTCFALSQPLESANLSQYLFFAIKIFVGRLRGRGHGPTGPLDPPVYASTSSEHLGEVSMSRSSGQGQGHRKKKVQTSVTKYAHLQLFCHRLKCCLFTKSYAVLTCEINMGGAPIGAGGT